jgi:DNA-binding MurR/RpiR family transcriptional regulator
MAFTHVAGTDQANPECHLLLLFSECLLHFGKKENNRFVPETEDFFYHTRHIAVISAGFGAYSGNKTECIFHFMDRDRGRVKPTMAGRGQNGQVPRDFENLRAIMIERKAEMPKRLAQVAAYSLSNPDEIAFGTAASIASAAQVQPSTLVRLAHHLGYDGFSDLQSIFRERLKEKNLSYEERLNILERQHSHIQEAELLSGFLNAAAQSIGRLAASIDPAQFATAIDILANAETIYLIAKRRSYPLTAHMAYAFGKLGIRYMMVASANGVEAEMAQFASDRDAVFAVSFSPYAADSIAHAESFAKRGVPVVAITDSVFSPLAVFAKCWFEVVESDFSGFRSLSASMALAMAVPVAVAEKRRQFGRERTKSSK